MKEVFIQFSGMEGDQYQVFGEANEEVLIENVTPILGQSRNINATAMVRMGDDQRIVKITRKKPRWTVPDDFSFAATQRFLLAMAGTTNIIEVMVTEVSDHCVKFRCGTGEFWFSKSAFTEIVIEKLSQEINEDRRLNEYESKLMRSVIQKLATEKITKSVELNCD